MAGCDWLSDDDVTAPLPPAALEAGDVITFADGGDVSVRDDDDDGVLVVLAAPPPPPPPPPAPPPALCGVDMAKSGALASSANGLDVDDLRCCTSGLAENSTARYISNCC